MKESDFMNKIILYHGSEKIIDSPKFGVGKSYNDYGLGFYTTEDIELAKEWAVDKDRSGFANKYELDLSNLKILDLSETSVLDWIAILLSNRFFELKSTISKTGKDFILKKYQTNFDDYDVIIGYRADDSYFMYANDFLNNSLSLRSLERALKLGNLGLQVVLKSKKAFDSIKFLGYEKVDDKIYFPLRQKRNIDAKNKYLLEKEKIMPTDIFLLDLIRGGKK